MLPKNWGEPMGAPAIIKLLHPASTLESRIQENVCFYVALGTKQFHPKHQQLEPKSLW
ncbi:MAG: hypothetical protein P8X79_19880 [Reinekea sp.]